MAGYGSLDNRIVDARGQTFMLRGVSLFWSQWMPQFYNPDTVGWLRSDWGINAIRASLAVHNNGYIDNPEQELAKIRAVIEAAIAEDIYVIIDWHAHLREEARAIAFFSDMARLYGQQPNVIFEIWNEPAAQYNWLDDIKPYHEAVIATIREYAPLSLVIAGTENFSQRVDIAARDPLFDKNTAYTLHFYAASHREKLRQRAMDALNIGVALVATEYGTCEADGNGVFAPDEMLTWWQFLEANGIGCFNWSISDKAETAAALVSGAFAEGGWTINDLTLSGRLVRSYLRAKRQPTVTDYLATSAISA